MIYRHDKSNLVFPRNRTVQASRKRNNLNNPIAIAGDRGNSSNFYRIAGFNLRLKLSATRNKRQAMTAPKISHELRSRANGAHWMTNASLVHVFWMRRAQNIASQNLMESFRQDGVTVSIFNNDEALRTLYDDHVDLCIIETAGHSIKEVKVLVNCIRAQSRVPLILLSEQLSTDWMIQMLVIGVDAVVSTQTPDAIVIARAKALLRRWRPQPMG
jgi:hypothetical protein